MARRNKDGSFDRRNKDAAQMQLQEDLFNIACDFFTGKNIFSRRKK